DGFAALDIAREQAPDIPFIFLSGTLGEERAVETLQRGAVDYVLKTNPARLVPAVRRALREMEERARRRAAEREIARLTRRLKMQSGINSAVLRIRDRDELLREACRLACDVGAYDRAVIFQVSSDGRTFTRWYGQGAGAWSDHVPAVLPIGDATEPDTSLTGRALRRGEITLCADLSRSEPPVAMRETLLEAGLRSLVALPLIWTARRSPRCRLARARRMWSATRSCASCRMWPPTSRSRCDICNTRTQPSISSLSIR